jgi:membrane-bound lytic murein transglycosylase D
MDVVKSTDAAARYLRDAYRVFGDWALAISAYNCGYGSVRKAIRHAGGKTDYWSIYPYLPTETRYYVPAMVGALYTLHYHAELGIKPTPCALPELTDTIHVRGKMHLQQVSDLVGTKISTLRSLNPQYKHDIIPQNGRVYVLTIPSSDSAAFIAQQDSIARHKADEYMSASVMKSIENSGTGQTIVYKVKSGDNLSIIAAKHHVTVAQLRKWNKLSGTVIRPGQKLYIYK